MMPYLFYLCPTFNHDFDIPRLFILPFSKQSVILTIILLKEILMPERSKDWFEQAKRDFNAAQKEEEAHFFEWACFIYQQAAEKALKAVYQKLAAEAWGHSIYNLLKGLQERKKIDNELFNNAKQLDRFYIPARYPNGWSEGFPGEFITQEDAVNARNCAEKILRFCEGILAE